VTPDELVAAVSPKINAIGSAFYFVPETLQQGTDLGIDGFRFYFIGRGGVLGDVEAAVVTAAFGYFNPTLIEDMWTSASATVAPRVAGRAFLECAATFGRTRFRDLDGLEAFCAALDTVNDAADPVALTLYAAARAEPLADDPAGRAMQLLSILRELRGSAHLCAVRVAGLDAKTAHFIRRPNDIGMFGWSEADAPEITDEHRARLAHADELTDALVLPAYAALDADGRQALADGLTAVEAALAP
jgi:hypothetical protein